MAEFDTVIKDGMIIDGTRTPRYQGDLGIKDGVVRATGRIPESAAKKTIDARGMIVAPGFIDLHTHYDAQLFWDPYCTLSGWHGITSLVIGNCGFGFAPMRPEDRERAMLSMTRVEAIPLASMKQGLPWDWVNFPDFMDSVDRAPKALNILPYVPAGPLIQWVLGFDDAKAGRLPTDAEHNQLAQLLDEAMAAGACGWSAQRLPPTGPAAAQRDFDGTPMITDVMHDETGHVLAGVLGKRNEGFMQMTLVTGDAKADNQRYEDLATISGRPVLYNVVQAYDHRPQVHRGMLRWLNSCRERGIKVYGQGMTTDAGFTFTFEDWNLFDDSNAWAEATTGSIEEKLAKLADPGRRQGLKDNPPVTATQPLAEITILAPRTAETKQYENLTVGEAAAKMGKDPVDAMLDIAVADGLKTLFFALPPCSSVDHLREIVQDPYILFGVSDGGAHTKFLTAGRYPTDALSRLVREHEMLTLEDAHWRLSALPATCAGFKNRGTLTEGAPADVVIYDYENLEVTPTETVYDLPGNEWRRIQRAKGYRNVLVNGEVILEDDRETGTHPGQLLRHGRGKPTS